MARQPRIEFAGAYYHVMARGDRREDIVVDEQDRELFVRTLGEACERTGWKVLAWVLMDNHYHLLIQTPEPNLVAGMKWFQNTYTRRLNVRHKLWGHVFGGRYRAVLVDTDQDEDYLGILLDYIHLNPHRAGLVNLSIGKGLLDYRWSSLVSGYGIAPRHRLGWMDVEGGLAFRNFQDTSSGRQRYLRSLETLAQSEAKAHPGLPEGQTLHSTLERGWYWGSQTFREKLLRILSKKQTGSNRNYRLSQPSKAHNQKRAREWIEQGMKALGKNAKDLAQDPGSAGWKVVVAWVVARKTSQPQSWIARELQMKSPGNVSQQLGRLKKGMIKLQPEEKSWRESVKND